MKKLKNLANMLSKGSARRLFGKLNPNKLPGRDPVNEWQQSVGTLQELDDSYDQETHQYARSAIPRMEGGLRLRALNKLSDRTLTRRHPETGKRQFLLFRGVSHGEKEAVIDGPFVQHEDHSSWSPKIDVARGFEGDYREEDGSPKTIAAWIDEDHIHAAPHMYGNMPDIKTDMDNGGAFYTPDKKITGKNQFSHEHEIVVSPHTSDRATKNDVKRYQAIHTPTRTRISQSDPRRDVNARINYRGEKERSGVKSTKQYPLIRETRPLPSHIKDIMANIKPPNKMKGSTPIDIGGKVAEKPKKMAASEEAKKREPHPFKVGDRVFSEGYRKQTGTVTKIKTEKGTKHKLKVKLDPEHVTHPYGPDSEYNGGKWDMWDHASYWKKSDGLKKTPMPNEIDDLDEDWQYAHSVGHFRHNPMGASFPYQTGQRPDGTFYHKVHIRNGVAHIISKDKEGEDPVAHMIVENKSFGPQIQESVVDVNHRGKGYGKALYLNALKHHGTLESDDMVSPEANKLYSKLAQHPNVYAKLDSFPGDSTHKLSFIKKPKQGKLAASELNKGARGDWKQEGYEISHIKGLNNGKKFAEKLGINRVAIQGDDNVFAIKDGKYVGHASFVRNRPIDLKVKPEHQRKGIASAMYAEQESRSGSKIKSSGIQTPDAKALWSQPNRPFAKSLAEMMTKGSARGLYQSENKNKSKNKLKYTSGIFMPGSHTETAASATMVSGGDAMGLAESMTKGAIRNAVAGGMAAAAMMMPTKTDDTVFQQRDNKINIQADVKPIIERMDKDKEHHLRVIAQVESSGGKDLDHVPVNTNMHRGTSALGKYGIMPLTIKETIERHPDLRDKFGHVVGKDLRQVASIAQENPEIVEHVASRFYDKLRRRYGNDIAKIGFSWNQGQNALMNDPDKDYLNHWHTKKILEADQRLKQSYGKDRGQK